MAKQNSLITFTGRLGNLIGYQRNGQYFLRSMPEIVRQTVATRRAAQRFGKASRKGALICNAFYNDLDIRCDSSHINRLNKILIEAAGNNAATTGFRFNHCTGIDRFLTVSPNISKDGILHIPPQIIAQYKGITALEVKVIAARIDFLTGQITGTETAVMIIDHRQSFAGADLAVDVSGAGTLVITLQVRGMQNGQPSGNKQYQAADIIAVMPPQAPKVFNKRTYPRYIRQTALTLGYTHACQSVNQRE